LLYSIRKRAVVVDSDLAVVYGVPTKVFNQAFKRNRKRFLDDFAFQLTPQEFRNLKSQIVTSSFHGGRRSPPWVFTEHGALMASTILNSDQAIRMSQYVIRAFVQQRELLSTNQDILKRLAEIEKTMLQHDNALWDVFQKLIQTTPVTWDRQHAHVFNGLN
jgi:hypothetical protein